MRKPIRKRDTRLAFETLSIEGGLFSAEWLSKVARLEADHQKAADYGVSNESDIRDEIARSWRIAEAYWKDFQGGRAPRGDSNDSQMVAERFVEGILREAFGFRLLTRSAGKVLGGRRFPIQFFALGDRVPVVVAPAGAGLDKALPQLGDGGRSRTAFGLLQEYLNASESSVWGLACDGNTLRIGRDNASLTRPAWVEADLGRIFAEERFSDFAVLWLLVHETRFGRADGDGRQCPLETWREADRTEGVRAREKLSVGFREALEILGQGFLSHRENGSLRKALETGTLTRQGYFEQLLRLVYRMIFLLVAEERDLLHPPRTPKAIRKLYEHGYGLRRLRDRAVRPTARDRYDDLWESVKIVFRSLGNGEPRLGLPALGGLFAPDRCRELEASRLENKALLDALYRLCWLKETSAIVRVNWRDIGFDELGYIYEGLLELTPEITLQGRSFSLRGSEGGKERGHERKTTGSYYTPDELVQLLLKSALDPVINKRLKDHPDQQVEALLNLSIVDPACGSGHFLLAAARRLADRVARLRACGTPQPEEYRAALRDVVRRCIYGVDLNPLAVELCKVNLWMESLTPGLPLTFLESHIRCGNSLLGTTRALMDNAVPDEAFEVLEGDDKKVTAALKKRNKAERAGQCTLSFAQQRDTEHIAREIEELDTAPDTDATSLAQKERRWKDLLASKRYEHEKLVHDAWCAAFLWPKIASDVWHLPGGDTVDARDLIESAPTTATWRKLAEGVIPEKLLLVTRHLAEEYKFFHWELAFPQVFKKGGFDVVLGNPPWERVKLQEQEFFASRDPAIAKAQNAAERKKLIDALSSSNPVLWREWRQAVRIAQGQSHFVRASGRYPLCGKGDVNTYALFAEHNWHLVAPDGRAGFIVPTGIATDDNTKEYFQTLVAENALRSLFDFRNTGFFSDVASAQGVRFSLITIGKGAEPMRFVFRCEDVTDVDDTDRSIHLTVEDFILFNPNTRTCPTFRSRRDAEINLAMYRRTGVLWRENDPDGNPWGLRFMAMFHMANDSGLFHTRAKLLADGWKLEGNRFVKGHEVMLPLYEAKMVHHFDHRFGDYSLVQIGERGVRQIPQADDATLKDPSYTPLPRYWVSSVEVENVLHGRWSHGWLLGWRDITSSIDRRTVIASVIPRVGVGHQLPLMMPSVPPSLVACLYGCLCSFILDYAARQKVGGTHLTYFFLKQLSVLRPEAYVAECPWHRGWTVQNWMLPRVLELTYTAWDLQPFAQDCGDDGPPYSWDRERRFLLRAELDAAFFHLYGLSRDEVGYVMDTFPIVRKHDETEYGEYRTRRVILEIYDALAEAMATGRTYVSPLGPGKRVK